jgi:hypothetical protein
VPEIPLSIVSDQMCQPDEQIVLVKTVQTCIVCPSQWDAWDAEGHYYYLRHRNGRGSVDRFDSPDETTWGTEPLGGIARFDAELPEDEDADELDAFCALAGITVAADAERISWAEYIERPGVR